MPLVALSSEGLHTISVGNIKAGLSMKQSNSLGPTTLGGTRTDSSHRERPRIVLSDEHETSFGRARKSAVVWTWLNEATVTFLLCVHPRRRLDAAALALDLPGRIFRDLCGRNSVVISVLPIPSHSQPTRHGSPSVDFAQKRP
jgi:hypothetical protein